MKAIICSKAEFEDFGTIQAAIDAAVSSDVVVLD
jgi:pectin methylesterase-like acyl-CoA thioesterase